MHIEEELKSSAAHSSTEEEFALWLYQEYYRLMFFTVQKYIADQLVQEEIIQECLRKLIEKTNLLRQFKRPVLAGYIVSTVCNTAINYLKIQQGEKDRIVDLAELTTQEALGEPSIDEKLILQEEIELFKKVWPTLDIETRILLEGKYILGYDNNRLGQLLGCQPSSVRMKLTRARRKALALIRKEENKHD